MTVYTQNHSDQFIDENAVVDFVDDNGETDILADNPGTIPGRTRRRKHVAFNA
jgi:hypothetical protein